MAQGKQPKKKNYILRNPGIVMKRFYDSFDHKFLYRKAQTLMFLVNERERFTKMVKQVEETSEEGTNKYLPSQDIDDKYFEGLRAEIYFIEMHQFEGFFALLLAVFQKLPHWLYLTTYGTTEIKTAIQHYVDGNISAVTNGAVNTVEDFVIHSVYAGFSPDEQDKDGHWKESVEALDWFIKRAGKRYLEAASEYNGYKHGLRVLTGHSKLAMWPNDAAGNPQGQGFVMGDSEDSVSFLTLEDKGEGGETVVEVTKHFNPKESFEHIQIMQLILDEVMRTRRGRINKDSLEYLQTIFIDREELQALRKYFTFSLTV
ncbi:MAG TPA: hypothetical protein VEL49_02895 [Ktedonobacteraceae bacterium]|nr:hypothetical protein [Ktedonobacteraceae bacterium]